MILIYSIKISPNDYPRNLLVFKKSRQKELKKKRLKNPQGFCLGSSERKSRLTIRGLIDSELKTYKVS